MLRLVFISAAVAMVAGCASVDRVPSTAYTTVEPSAIAFKRDLYLLEAGSVFTVADVKANVFKSEWQAPWQNYELDAQNMTEEQAQLLDDEFYNLPIWRTDEEARDDLELKDNLSNVFGRDIQLLYRAPKAAFASREAAQDAYLAAAEAFHSEIVKQNSLNIASESAEKIAETEVPQRITLTENNFKLSAFETGKRISVNETDSDFYASGLVFEPKMKALDMLTANIFYRHEQFLDAAVLAYLAVGDENLYLVLGQSPTIRMPPGVIDANGNFYIAYSYKDGKDVQLPVELLLYQTRKKVHELTK